MISSEQIQQAVKRLVAAASPSKVVLFGSYARGDATEDSDLDLMVIEREVPNKFDGMVRLRQELRCTGHCTRERFCMKSALDLALRYLEVKPSSHSGIHCQP